MSNTIEAAITEVLFGGSEESFIQCGDGKMQESIRIMAYAAKNKIKSSADKEVIGITKVKEDEKLYVRIYRKLQEEIWVRDRITGKLIPKRTLIISSENERAVEAIRKEGYGEDAVKGYLEAAKNNLPFEVREYVKKGKVEVEFEKASPESAVELTTRESEKAAMLKMLEGEE